MRRRRKKPFFLGRALAVLTVGGTVDAGMVDEGGSGVGGFEGVGADLSVSETGFLSLA